MKANQKIGNVTETRTLLELSKHRGWGFRVMKRYYRLAVLILVAFAGSGILGGSIWGWLVGLLVTKLLARLVLTVALAIILYILFFVLIFGGLFLVLIS